MTDILAKGPRLCLRRAMPEDLDYITHLERVIPAKYMEDYYEALDNRGVATPRLWKESRINP